MTVTNKLTFDKHINRITGETYNLLRNITTTFTYLDEEMVKKLITSIIRPRLEYATVVWSPRLKVKVKLGACADAARGLGAHLRHIGP